VWLVLRPRRATPDDKFVMSVNRAGNTVYIDALLFHPGDVVGLGNDLRRVFVFEGVLGLEVLDTRCFECYGMRALTVSESRYFYTPSVIVGSENGVTLTAQWPQAGVDTFARQGRIVSWNRNHRDLLPITFHRTFV
jgi:hypothetical protein